MKSENARWSNVLSGLQFIALLASIALMTLGWLNWKASGLKPTAAGDAATNLEFVIGDSLTSVPWE